VASIDKTLVGDYDVQRRRVRLRAATTKTRKALWVELHPVLADALEARLGPREDRDAEARLFADSGADALRTSSQVDLRARGLNSGLRRASSMAALSLRRGGSSMRAGIPSG
jgi:hypothetical protein